MALQVWLPLNGNLNNQGLSNVSVTSSDISYSTGKVTGKSKSKGTVNLSTEFMNNIKVNHKVTIAFWIKPTGTAGTAEFMGNSSNRELCNLFQYPKYDDLHLSYYLADNSTVFSGYILNDAFSDNQWHHITIVNDTGLINVYNNGVLSATWGTKGTWTRTIFSPFQLKNNNLNYLNDVRIYDECLSEKQIKELSKGLCLHYELSRGGENLLTNSIGEFSGNNTSTSSYKDFKSWPNIVTPESDSWYTTSFDLKGNINGSYFYQYLFNNSTGRQCDKSILYINGKLIGNYTASDGNTGLIPVTTDWKHIEIVRHFNTNTTALAKTLLFRIKTGTNYTVYIRNVKLEKGDHATPWIPNKSDAIYSQLGYNNIEPDCSGYGNDGTINGTLTYSNDTPRYEGSSYFPMTSNYITVPPKDYSGMANSYSISYWAKIPDMNDKMAWGFNDGNRLNLYPIGNVICCNTGDSANNPFQVNGASVTYTQYNGAWHHYCMIGNGSAVILYIDGVEVGRAKTYKAITGTQLKISGWSTNTDYKWIGNISDFRIYATALSAEDIKELYNVSASLCDNYTFMVREVVEQ